MTKTVDKRFVIIGKSSEWPFTSYDYSIYFQLWLYLRKHTSLNPQYMICRSFLHFFLAILKNVIHFALGHCAIILYYESIIYHQLPIVLSLPLLLSRSTAVIDRIHHNTYFHSLTSPLPGPTAWITCHPCSHVIRED